MDRASARQNFDGDAVALIQYHETDREFLKRRSEERRVGKECL